MAELRHIEHILDTQANFRADGDLGQSGILTDQSEEMVYKNDDATKEFHVANQYYWNGAANQYFANSFGEITMFDDILVAEYLKRSGGTDDLIRFENDKTTFQNGGATNLILEDNQIFLEFSAKIKEAAAAIADTAGYGQFWVKNDTPCTPWFTDDAGDDYQLAAVLYAEMKMYEATQAVTINTGDVYHGVYGYSTGSLKGFTFDAGRNVDADITSEADNTVLRIVTSAAHNLTTGDIVTCTNMNDAAHNAPTQVTVINATTFDCDDITYVAGAGASDGVVDEPSYLQAGTGTTGDFVCSMSVSGSSGGNGKIFKWEIFKGVTEIDTIVGERSHSVTDIGVIACSGIITSLAAGDRIWLACKNTTPDTTNFSIEHSNINLHKL